VANFFAIYGYSIIPLSNILSSKIYNLWSYSQKEILYIVSKSIISWCSSTRLFLAFVENAAGSFDEKCYSGEIPSLKM